MNAVATPTVKEAVIDVIRQMPDDATVEDIMEALYVRQKIDAGLKDVAEGRTLTHEEAMKRLSGRRHEQEDAR